jgi:hypothetical protein
MNTTRVIDQPPNLDINPDNLLSTNMYIPSITSQKEDLSQYQKDSFRQYIENSKKNAQTKKTSESITGDYDYFASVPASLSKSSTITKDRKEILKIEKPSIIDIDSKNRDKNAYPQPSSFVLPLGKTFYNIKSIELVSTAIPNTDQTITNTPTQIRNNRITWENYEDRDLGMYFNRTVSRVGDYIHITILNHGLESQIRKGNFYIKISRSNTTPNIDGERIAEIFDSNTLRIPFIGGIVTTGTADIDTGIPNYTVELTPGNYTASTIVTEIQKQMNLIKRRNGISNIYHYFTVSVNLDTDVISFRSYITKQLPNSPLSTTGGSGIITVTSQSHGFKSGDYVLIINAKSTGGIVSSILNGLFIIDVLNSDTFTYEVNERASESGIGGGTTCKTGEPSDFRLLFDTADSLIVDNIGFPGEDSSEKVGTSETCISTKTISPSSIVINGDYLTITSNNHELEESNVLVISSVTPGAQPIVTSLLDHNLGKTETVYISYSHSTPRLEGFYPITPTSNNTFKINSIEVLDTTAGTGVFKFGGDIIKLMNFNSIPSINGIDYFVENVTPNTFEIKAKIEEIQTSSLSDTVIRTNQIFVNHPGHGFNKASSIQPDTSTTAIITTVVPHGLSGTKTIGALKQTVVLNTVDIIFPGNHGLSTSDKVFISNSLNGASINGTFSVQVLTLTSFRITFVGGTDPGTCDVNIGDTVIFTNSNSTPKISSNNLNIPYFYVDYISPTTFRIETGFPITVPGTFAILGRNNDLTLHRITASEPGGSTIGGIPLSSINSVQYSVAKLIDSDNYMMRIKDHATFTTSGGGSNTVISSINHGKKKFQSNTFDGLDTGVLYKVISLEGENYIYIVSPGLQTVFAPGNETVGDIFSRIVLREPPGNMMFDTFVSVPKEFNPPLRSLKDITLEVKRSDGILFNFKDMDYSCSLRIVEVIDRISNTEFSSTIGTSDLY